MQVNDVLVLVLCVCVAMLCLIGINNARTRMEQDFGTIGTLVWMVVLYTTSYVTTILTHGGA